MQPAIQVIQPVPTPLREPLKSDETINIQPAETDIINGCRKNDRKAQEQLYRSYYGAMINLCLRYTRNEADALDVLNTGFLKVFQNIQRYDSKKGSLYTWIRTVVVRSCLDFIRQKGREDIAGELADAEEMHIEADAIQQLETARLLQLIRQLAPSAQAVFNLFVIEGYSHKEIAQLLHISEGTSKWHLSEARKNLQQMITQNIVKI